MAKEKEHLNLAFIGHVDHGKSTLVGHLLLKAGAIAEQQLDDGENKFRFVMDKLGEERERGVTIDLAHQKFSTKKYDNYRFSSPKILHQKIRLHCSRLSWTQRLR